VAFTPEGGKLLVTTKGNTGAIEIFDANALGGASLHPVVTSLPGAVRFAATVDSVGNLADRGRPRGCDLPRQRRQHA